MSRSLARPAKPRTLAERSPPGAATPRSASKRTIAESSARPFGSTSAAEAAWPASPRPRASRAAAPARRDRRRRAPSRRRRPRRRRSISASSASRRTRTSRLGSTSRVTARLELESVACRAFPAARQDRSFAIASGEGGFSVRLSRISASRPFAMPRRSATESVRAAPMSAASARRTCSRDVYGSRADAFRRWPRERMHPVRRSRRSTSAAVSVSTVRPPVPGGRPGSSEPPPIAARRHFPSLGGLADRVGGFGAGLPATGLERGNDVGNERRPFETAERAHARCAAVCPSRLRESCAYARPDRLPLPRGDLRRMRIATFVDCAPARAADERAARAPAGRRCRAIATAADRGSPPRTRASACVRSCGYEIVTSVISPAAFVDGFELRHHESGIRRQIQLVDARDHLVAQLRIEVDAVGLEQLPRRRRSRPAP